MKKKAVASLAAGLISILILMLSDHCALADRRVALVFGNSAYQNAALQAGSPKNDADDIANALKKLGFEVLLATDSDLASAGKAIQQFARSAQGADAALFFFAGHALQYQGENFLLPVDADIKDEISLPFETISLASIRAALDRSRGIKIMILDAARRNPIAENLAALATGRSDSSNPQVSAFERARGVDYADKNDDLIVVFSAAPESIASDLPGRNSAFTTALLQRLNEPGLEIETLFRRVDTDVETLTSGRQKPAIFSSAGQDYYLNQEDHFAWDKIKTTQDPAELRDFLERFPSSYFIFEARHRLKALQAALDAVAERAKAAAKENAEREARVRHEAELACQSARKKLGELDPHDQAAFGTLSETAPCDGVRVEAKAKLAASLALIAKEADVCRKDTAFLASLGGDDLARIASLAKNSLCEEVKKAAREKQSLLEAQRQEEEIKRLRDVEICKKEEAGLKALAAASTSEAALRELEVLQNRHECPGLTTPIEMALANQRSALDAACQKDQKALNALAPRDTEGLKIFAARKDLCGTVKESAIERLSELGARMAREADTCKREELNARQLVTIGDSQELEALRAKAQCPLVTAFIDQSLQAITAARTQACVSEKAELATLEAESGNKLDPGFMKSAIGNITAFSLRAACGDAKFEAENKLKSLQAQLAKREAEIAEAEAACRDERTRWAKLATPANSETLKKFRAEMKCLSLAPEIDQKIAALATACDKEAKSLANLNEADHDGLRSLADSATCEETKNLATAKLAALETRLAQEAETCRKDQEKWQSVATQGNKAALEDFRTKAKCASLIPAVEQKIAALATACEKEAKNLARLDEADHDGLKSLAASAVCDETRYLAAAKLAALDSRLAQEAEICRADEEQWQSVAAQGSKAALEAFRAKAKCANLIPGIDQKIAALASACEKEAKSLARLGEADHDGLKSLAASAVCDETRNLAAAKLAALDSRLAQEAETCRADEEQWQSVAAQGSKAALETFRAKAKCANLILVIDQKITALASICEKETKTLSSLNEADRNGLQTLAASATCDETRNSAVAKLAAIDSRHAQEAETCRKETARWGDLASSGNQAVLKSFRAQAKCTALYQDIDQRITALAQACEKDTKTLASLSDTDREGLATFNMSAKCDEAKENGKIRLAKLEQTLAQQDKICRDEDVLRQGLANSTHRADLAAFRQSLHCPKVIASIDQQIASLEASCASDQKNLDGLGERDLDRLKSLNAATKCENVKANAAARLNALQAKLDDEAAASKTETLAREREAKICQQDEEKFKRLGDSNDKAKVESIRKHTRCVEIIAKIDERLTAIDTECRKEEGFLTNLGKTDIAGMKDYLAHAECETSKNIVKLRLEAALTPQDTAPSGAKHVAPEPEAEHHREKRPKRESEPKEPVKTKTAVRAPPPSHRPEPSQSASREPPRAASPRAESYSTPHNVPSFGTGF